MKCLRLCSFILCALLATSFSAQAGDETTVSGNANPKFFAFTGGSYTNYTYYGYVGGVFAIDGDLYSEGTRLQLNAGAGHYTYDKAPGVQEGANFEQGSALAGYNFKFGKASSITTYAGLDVQAGSSGGTTVYTQGSRSGIKGQVEIYAPLNDKFYTFTLANISSVRNSYYTSAKLGYLVADKVSFRSGNRCARQ